MSDLMADLFCTVRDCCGNVPLDDMCADCAQVQLLYEERNQLQARLKTCLGNCAVHERNETAAIEKHFALLERLEGLMREDWVPAKLAAIIREARDE